MVRVRKLAQQVVRDELLLWRLLAPLREALRGASQLDASLNQSALGALASRRLMPGAFLLLLLPLVFVLVPLGFIVVATHLKAMRLYGPVVTWGLEGLLAAIVVGRLVGRLRDARRPEVEPVNEELTLAPAEVEERLASGQLRPFDLVHDGQVWRTLEQSPQFEFACEVPLARLRTRRRLVAAAKVLGWAALVVVAMRWLFSDEG